MDPDNPDLPALTALRYEQFGDYLTALEQFKQLRDKFATDPNARVAYLFAAKRAVEDKTLVEKRFGAADPTTVRVKMLDSRLKEASDLLAEGQKDEAYSLVLNLIALYHDTKEADIAARVAKARVLRKTLRGDAPARYQGRLKRCQFSGRSLGRRH